jgi:hypothetical protein
MGRRTDRAAEDSKPVGNPPWTSPAHQVVAPSAGIAELEAHTAAAGAALAVITNRASQDRANEAAEQEHLAAQAAEAGRRRREAAELDETTGTTRELDDVAESGAGDG